MPMRSFRDSLALNDKLPSQDETLSDIHLSKEIENPETQFQDMGDIVEHDSDGEFSECMSPHDAVGIESEQSSCFSGDTKQYISDYSNDISYDENFIPMTLSCKNASYWVPESSSVWEKVKKRFRRRPGKSFASDIENPSSSKKESVLKKYIVNDFSGCFVPGELVAIMGPSGSSKTTLLDMISAKLPEWQIDGLVTINGRVVSPEICRDHVAYVPQHDTLHPNLTVTEVLQYTHRLHFPGASAEEESRNIKEVLEELGMWKCRNNIIGDGDSHHVSCSPGSALGCIGGTGSNDEDGIKGAISGGERRRVSIAVELLKKPSLLICDEPTTGLDSFTALSIIQTLKQLATGQKFSKELPQKHSYSSFEESSQTFQQERTVICTIHQPQSAIYKMFDKILLLARGGHVVYFGKGGVDAVEYFEKLGYPCDRQTNPSDHFLDLITGTGTCASRAECTEDVFYDCLEYQEDSEPKNIIMFEENFSSSQNANIFPSKSEILIKAYQDSGLKLLNEQDADNYLDKNIEEPDFGIFSSSWLTALSLNSHSAGSRLKKYAILCGREFRMYSRKKGALLFRILQPLFIGILIGLTFFQTGHGKTGGAGSSNSEENSSPDQKTALDLRGVLFFLVFSPTTTALLSALPFLTAPSTLPVLKSDYFSNLYGLPEFYFSKLAFDIPILVTGATIYSVGTYFMVGLKLEWNAFLIYWTTILFCCLIGQAMGTVISILCALLPSMIFKNGATTGRSSHNGSASGADTASVIASLVFGLLFLSGGYLVSVGGLQWWFLVALVDANFIRHAYEIVSVNQFSGMNFSCEISNSTGFENFPNGNETSIPGIEVPEQPEFEPNGFQKFWYRITHNPFKSYDTLIEERKQREMEKYKKIMEEKRKEIEERRRNATESSGSQKMISVNGECLFATGDDVLRQMTFLPKPHNSSNSSTNDTNGVDPAANYYGIGYEVNFGVLAFWYVLMLVLGYILLHIGVVGCKKKRKKISKKRKS